MRTKEIELFKFEELSEEAQQKTIEKLYDINVDHEWYDFVVEDFIDNDEEVRKHFEPTKVYFSGFYSQGDGAMFEYDFITDKLVDEAIDNLKIKHKLAQFKINAMKKAKDFSGKGQHSGHYSHEKCCSHILEFGAYPTELENIEDLFALYHEDIEDFIIDKYEDIAKDLYRRLEKEYDYLTSEEVIKETIVANEYEFLIDGGEIQ